MMKNLNLKNIASIFILILFTSSITFAADDSSIKFFVSNNTQEINMENAYERLIGVSQDELKKGIIDILQKNHVEQGKFEDILGTYKMVSDKNMTADNAEIFLPSPSKNFSNEQIFSLARELANTFQQESVAIFIPSSASIISDVVVKFSENKSSITAVIKLIQEKLPAYSNAFSLHLINTSSTFNEAKVSEIEWLGNKINIDEIKKAFPQDAVSYSNGQAYLVYKNGQVESL